CSIAGAAAQEIFWRERCLCQHLITACPHASSPSSRAQHTADRDHTAWQCQDSH
ncbi:hypothetical protein M9458_024625, partial [Cirrhinus mrigala]